MPCWAARMATLHVRFVAIDHGEGAFTVLAVAWVVNAPDAARHTLLEIVSQEQELPHLIRQLC